ncbi:MAG: hypothetical protein HQK76_11695 [Desulfobacterales bacterium]|nr:hypothetical protein [Desulfobacterales bacterium]
METYEFDGVTINLNKKGSQEYSKVSYPIRYGVFNEIVTKEYNFQFNLNGEIKFIQGRRDNWPNPVEWLKRTVTNDWVYYLTGAYSTVYDLIGEYYIPCFLYPSNSIFGGNPFEHSGVKNAIDSFEKLSLYLKEKTSSSLPSTVKNFFSKIEINDDSSLKLKAYKFLSMIGGRITVLPPDARHVDYDVIPLIIADGCLYNCGFCRVKSGQVYSTRVKNNILFQINQLKEFYNDDIKNYNSLFLGTHDALNAGEELIEYASLEAYKRFNFKESYIKGANLFLFGSVDSLLNSKNSLFQKLNSMPFNTYVNIGLESADALTLQEIQKPITHKMVIDAFEKILDINRTYNKLEITSNFIIGANLGDKHFSATLKLLRDKMPHFYSKGAAYFSPLHENGTKKEIIEKFEHIKKLSRLPAYIYIIQRL